MAVGIFFAAMAAFGMICVLWTLFGWMIPGSTGGCVVVFAGPGLGQLGFIHRCLFLKGLGMIACPVIVVDLGLEAAELRLLERKCGAIELCSREELPGLLELERNQIDRTGNGNHSGRDQRRGISEL